MTTNTNNLPADDFAAVVALIAAALAKGYSASVHDGEEWTIRRSTDRDALIGALGTTDEDSVRFYDNGNPVGTVWLVYGNRDGTTVHDNTDNPATAELADAAERAASDAAGIH